LIELYFIFLVQARYWASYFLRDYPLLVPKSVGHQPTTLDDEGERKRRFRPFTVPVRAQVSPFFPQ
jgi:hypothetical protein